MSMLAIDIGSSTCKAVVFAGNGAPLAQHFFSYSPEYPQPGHAELSPEIFWNAVCACSRAVAGSLHDPVRALCLSSHGETFVPVDVRGRPLMRAILNQDNRAVEEVTQFSQVVGERQLFEI